MAQTIQGDWFARDTLAKCWVDTLFQPGEILNEAGALAGAQLFYLHLLQEFKVAFTETCKC